MGQRPEDLPTRTLERFVGDLKRPRAVAGRKDGPLNQNDQSVQQVKAVAGARNDLYRTQGRLPRARSYAELYLARALSPNLRNVASMMRRAFDRLVSNSSFRAPMDVAFFIPSKLMLTTSN